MGSVPLGRGTPSVLAFSAITGEHRETSTLCNPQEDTAQTPTVQAPNMTGLYNGEECTFVVWVLKPVELCYSSSN